MRDGTWQSDANTSGETANNAVVPTGNVRVRAFRWQLGNSLLNLYAIFCTVAVLALICVGGVVTSKGAGLTVPDWPTSYGYNMFAFPISRWVGGIFYEHVHRLIASGVGMLTIGLAVWLWLADYRHWMRWLGIVAVFAVSVQGLLGGLRVTQLKDEIGIFHACLAQAFLVLMGFIALATSRWWQQAKRASSEKFSRSSSSRCHPERNESASAAEGPSSFANATGHALQNSTLRLPPSAFRLSYAFLFLAGVIYIQLALGATMRHAHAGLSIRDFPTAYGKWWPATDPATIARINRERMETLGLPRTSAAQIHLQMTHRLGAGIIAIGACAVAVMTWRRRASLPSALAFIGMAGPVLVAGQITLGIYTIWTNKAADVATLHVAVGAITLLWASLTGLALHRWAKPADASAAISTGMISQPMEVAI